MNHFPRKLASLFLTFTLLCSLVVTAQLPVEASSSSVITISSASDLEQIRNNPTGDFELSNDIQLSGEFIPISSFSGTLDGKGHHISGLSITANSSQPKAALIVTNYGTIERIGLVDVNITSLDTNSTYWAGGMVATNRGTIQESFVTGSVVGGYRSAGIAVNNYSVIRNVYAAAEVSARVESGGLVAVSESGSTLSSSYAVPDVYSEEFNTGGISAYAYSNATIEDNALLAGTIANGDNLNAGRITGRVNGTPTFSNNIASQNALVQGAVVTGGTSGNAQGLSVTDQTLTEQSAYENTLGWDFQSVWEMNPVLERPTLQYAGEIQDVEIAAAADLELIRSDPYGSFVLTADIELSGEFVPIPSFYGSLDGDGHHITGLTITSDTSQRKAAFIVDHYGVIKNVGFADVAIMGLSSDSTYWAGGMVANNRGTIRESFVTGVVTGGYRSAGIAVHNFNLIRNSYTDVMVRAKVEAGALVAVSESGSVLETSYAVPDVHSQLNNTGGVSGYAYSSAIIRNNALLAGTITNGGNSNIARVNGRVNGTPVFQNNIASEQALVQGIVVTEGTASNRQGLSVTDQALGTQSTYVNLGWNFNVIWEMDSQLGRPVLQSLENPAESVSGPIIRRPLRDESVVVSQGVQHRQMDFIDVNGNVQKANIIDVDLNLPQNEIIVGTKNNQIPPTDANGDYIRIEDSEGHDSIKANVADQAATTQIAGKEVVAGVNGEFYTEQGPEGYMIKDGSGIINGVRVPGVDGKNYPFHGFFGIKDNGTPVIGSYTDDWEQMKEELFQASGGQYWMVKDGVHQDFNGLVISDPNHPDYDEQTYYRHNDRHPRTAVGIRSDGTVFFVVIDGRGANGSTGFYIEELGLYMKELGAYQALNMDGGGSSTAVVTNGNGGYDIENTPINKVDGVNTPGAPRDVFSSLLVVVEQD
ncbi:phosphodiester glycosidase family protein [Paenibacillus lemnae]|uniref:Phosphodiester glycosidase family protein n=1 Tax=Paenibacillus lemnae TaxID=1330551 RepID=A0A848M7Y1_PAELE|nr:phosphodiester glycosidase family protein [Paenibacillus lemnae]NMO96736.1 phosphodiester glycosidase family protein [Paenibacillus lemnae]